MKRVQFCKENVQYAKAIKSGPLLRVIEVKPEGDYINGMPERTSKKRVNEKNEVSSRFESSIARTKSKMKEHIFNNFLDDSAFLTLTYKDENMNFYKYDESLVHFDLFIKELRKKYPNIKYIAVPEEQIKRAMKYNLKCGPIHFHIIVDKRKISEKYVNKIWQHGLVFKKKTYGKPMKLVNYLTKYMTKTFVVKGNRKSYLRSRNLTKSEIVTGIFEAYDFAMNLIKKGKNIEIVTDCEFDSFIGRVHIIDYYFPDEHLHFEADSG